VCADDAAALGEIATSLDSGTSVEVTESPDVTARGDHDELLATYESPAKSVTRVHWPKYASS